MGKFLQFAMTAMLFDNLRLVCCLLASIGKYDFLILPALVFIALLSRHSWILPACIAREWLWLWLTVTGDLVASSCIEMRIKGHPNNEHAIMNLIISSLKPNPIKNPLYASWIKRIFRNAQIRCRYDFCFFTAVSSLPNMWLWGNILITLNQYIIKELNVNFLNFHKINQEDNGRIPQKVFLILQ